MCKHSALLRVQNSIIPCTAGVIVLSAQHEGLITRIKHEDAVRVFNDKSTKKYVYMFLLKTFTHTCFLFGVSQVFFVC